MFMMLPHVPSETGPALLLANGLVMLGDFVAHVAATNGAGDCCQCSAFAAANLTTYKAAYQGANANAKWAVLGDRSWLLICGGWSVISYLLGLRQLRTVGVIGGLVTTGGVMAHDRFVLNNLPLDWCRCRLLCKRGATPVRHFCGWTGRDRTMGIGKKPRNRGDADQAHQGNRDSGGGHQWVDAIRGSGGFHFRSPVWR
jgi:hypothetical protein